MKVLGISGSPRKNGNTDILLKFFSNGVKSRNIDISNIYLRDYNLKPCIGCEKCRKDKTCTAIDDDMKKIYSLIDNSDTIILGSPTYFYSVTAITKIFIDRLYCYFNFIGERPGKYKSRLADKTRYAIIYNISEQDSNKETSYALLILEKALESLGFIIFDKMAINGIYEKGKIRNNSYLLDTAFEKGKDLGDLLLSLNTK